MPKQKPTQPDERTLARELCVEIVTRGEGDEETKTVQASFSTEQPVREYATWNGAYQPVMRLLDHSDTSVDMSRVADGLPIEDNHYGDQIGLADVTLANRKLSGPIRFGASERAQVISQDARDGIRRNLSIYAQVDPDSYKLDGEQDGLPVLRVMSWQPLSAAFVNVGADPKAGVGRELDRGQEDTAHDDPNTADAGAVPAVTTPPTTTTRSKQTMPDEPTTIESPAVSTEDIVRMYALGRYHDVPAAEVDTAIRAGQDLATFTDSVLARIATAAPKENEVAREVAIVGLSEKETKQFSIMRAIECLKDNKPCFEREVSDALARQLGKDPSGIYIPYEKLVQRDLSPAGTGGNLVDTQLKTGSFIDILQSNMVLDKLGVTMLGGLVGDISIPKQSGGATAYWVADGSAVTESDQTLAQVSGKPHTVGAFTDVTRNMRLQSSIDAERFVMTDLARTLGQGIQTAVFAGTGVAGQPKGLLYADDLNTGTITTPGSATWANILTFVGTVMADNVSVEAGGAWVMRPLVWASLAGIPKTTGEANFLLDAERKTMAGFPYQVTTGIPAKHMFFGIWSNLVLGMWGGLDLTLDTSTGSSAGTLRVVALQDVDVLCRHGQAFSYNTGVIA